MRSVRPRVVSWIGGDTPCIRVGSRSWRGQQAATFPDFPDARLVWYSSGLMSGSPAPVSVLVMLDRRGPSPLVGRGSFAVASLNRPGIGRFWSAPGVLVIDPSLSRPVGVRGRFAFVVILVGLGGAVVSLAVAPVLMPESYSWVSHTTSESAAQGVEGAWLARLGFVLSGLAVLWLVGVSGRRWEGRARVLHGGFGVFMVATAAFSARSWETAVPFDPVITPATFSCSPNCLYC